MPSRKLLRVGHKGAHHIVPGNTPASFDAALEHGVDMIEFDVLPEDWRAPTDSPLYLAHDPNALARARASGGAPSLADGLAHLARPEFAAVALDVDLKLPGYEDRVVQALRAHGLVERALVSSQYPASLDRVRALEPALRVGWSVPRARRDYTESRLYAVPALALLAVFRARLPGLAARRARPAASTRSWPTGG